MTEHSIEELERQLQAARDRTKQAHDDYRAAEERLQNARNEASGVMGHVLEFTVSRGYGRNAKLVTKRILVEKVTPGWARDGIRPLKASGHYIVANGTVGVMRGDTLVNDAKDLGPYLAKATA